MEQEFKQKKAARDLFMRAKRYTGFFQARVDKRREEIFNVRDKLFQTFDHPSRVKQWKITKDFDGFMKKLVHNKTTLLLLFENISYSIQGKSLKYKIFD